MAKRAFDWSRLTRIDIFDHMQSVRSSVTKRYLPITVVYNIVANHIRKIAPVRVYKKTNWDVPHDFVYIGGMYDSELDQDKKKCILINLLFNPLVDKFRFSKETFIMFSKEIADTILHEVIHMRQYRRRNFKSRPDYRSNVMQSYLRQQQSYLGNKDEIDAYSFNIACELYDKFGCNQSKILKFLNQSRPRRSIGLKNYLKTFNYDHNHPVIIELKKKIKNYLSSAELGKPYKNNYWLTY